MPKARTKRRASPSRDASDNAKNDGLAPVKSTKRLRGRRGGLKDMIEMPLDVLYEIFSHMHPLDLLNLARSCKDFRALLMTRTSASLWKTARRNVQGLPDCPSFMSEPAYATLCFNTHCHGCLKPNIKHVFWSLRTRLCSACKRDQLIDCLSYDFFTRSMVPTDQDTANKNKRRRYFGVCLVSEKASIDKEHAACNSDVERAEYKQRQQALILKIQEFARACTAWNDTRKEARIDELEAMRRSRLNAIVNRLRGCGWGEELDHMANNHYSSLALEPSVKRPGELTERAWKNMQPELIKFMEEAKRMRLRAERIIVLQSRLDVIRDLLTSLRKHHGANKFPPLRPFIMIPKIMEIFQAPNEEGDITMVTNKSIIPHLWPPLKEWRETARLQLDRHIKQITHLPESCSTTSLALTSFYVCRRCHNVYTCDLDILSHECRAYRDPDFTTSESDPIDVVLEGLAPLDVTSMFMEVDLVKPVIVACGQDPLEVSVETMDSLDIKLTCMMKCCTQFPGVRSVMSWRLAVIHSLEKSPWPPKDGQWVQATAFDNDVVGQLEAACATSNTKAGAEVAKYGQYCITCEYAWPEKLYRSGTYAEISEHLREEHGTDHKDSFDGLRMLDHNSISVVPYLISRDVEARSLPLDLQYVVLKGSAAFEVQPQEQGQGSE